MWRFPNPGSDIANFVAVYTAAFKEYNGSVVTLDNIVKTTVAANLATSSGYMGTEAIARSTRANRSNDPLFNQLKMYAELFRTLGWLRSTDGQALKCTFTLLGEQLVAAGQHWQGLVGETVLGITYPSHVIALKGGHNIRPFATILKTMLACDHYLSRDEIIVGPLSATTDRKTEDITKIASQITALRSDPSAIKTALHSLSVDQNVQINTLKNYTRWPLAIMRTLDWTEIKDEVFCQGSPAVPVYRLTSHGREKAKELAHANDLRIDQIDALPFEKKYALARCAHFQMMGRAGFDLTSVMDELDQRNELYCNALETLGCLPEQLTLFSPFQSLLIADTKVIFPTKIAQLAPQRELRVINSYPSQGRSSREHLFVTPNFLLSEKNAAESELESLRSDLICLKEKYETIEGAAESFVLSRQHDTQRQFYPLITHLLRLLGFKSDCSRIGVNNQRWDACVDIDGMTIPIEIKSPTEECFLSTKAVRQAMENKVILLSRYGAKTRRELSSLIVGYKIPNERSDISRLLDDVYKTYNFKIGVLDLRSLTVLALKASMESVSIDKNQLSQLKGFINV